MDILGLATMIFLLGGFVGILYSHGNPDRRDMDWFFSGILAAGFLLLIIGGSMN